VPPVGASISPGTRNLSAHAPRQSTIPTPVGHPMTLSRGGRIVVLTEFLLKWVPDRGARLIGPRHGKVIWAPRRDSTERTGIFRRARCCGCGWTG